MEALGATRGQPKRAITPMSTALETVALPLPYPEMMPAHPSPVSAALKAAHQPLDVSGNIQAMQQSSARPQPQKMFGLNDPNSVVGQLADIGNTVMTSQGIEPFGATNSDQYETVDSAKFGAPLNPRFSTELKPSAQQGVTLFHGSPHLFDKFELSKIGTGEGAQAYGHGLYFAENPKIAQSYMDELYKATPVLLDGKPMRDVLKGESSAAPLAVLQMEITHDAEKAVQRAKSQGMPDVAEWIENNRHRLEVNPGGAMYSAELPDEHMGNMLDWDLPIGKQSPEVRAKLQAAIGALGSKSPNVYHYRVTNTFAANPEAKVASVYEAMVDSLGGSKSGGRAAASELLKENGIPGIKYFDQASRKKQGGTRNIVLFDPSLIKSVARNGAPVSPAGMTKAYHGTTEARLPDLLEWIRNPEARPASMLGLDVTDTPERAARYANAQVTRNPSLKYEPLKPGAVVVEVHVPRSVEWQNRGTDYARSLDAVEHRIPNNEPGLKIGGVNMASPELGAGNIREADLRVLKPDPALRDRVYGGYQIRSLLEAMKLDPSIFRAIRK